MLTIYNLSVKYNKNVVLQDVSLQINEGKIYGVFGLNGSGKTTFFNALYGFNYLSTGEIQYKSKKLDKTLIAYLEAELYFYPYITGKEYLDIFKYKHNQIFDIVALASLFNIPLNSLIESYSLGMKKKIAILGILALNRPIYIFDEPFNGLDIESVNILKAIVEILRDKNKTILISSHIIDSLLNICDSFICIEDKTLTSELDQSQFMAYCQEIYNSLNKEVLRTVL